MSYKSTNGIKMTKCDSQQWKTNSIHETSVKFAGEEAKDRLYEPKHKKKLVRVLTVVAYVFFVSLAAIMLSLYYVFLWNGDQKIAAKYVISQPKQQRQYLSNKCNSILAELQQQITAIESEELTVSSTIPTTSEESVTWLDDYEEFERPTGIFLRKIIGRYDY
ncbi:uncharacterized protein LOC108908864 isoform X2 [Anoplophora glabripennis]|uniref:uncharacterized protein LOC108908864 isoform X2 n=1 Tax=Anoplophora glabripennis TaxID=217634 RepID=UPI0008747BA4|nr:uncharacterized protein LOC108908864 isoform X2 [Anoplophora glabripennis]